MTARYSASNHRFHHSVRWEPELPAEDLGRVRCPRCWRWVEGLEPCEQGNVCSRCVEALKS